MRKCDCITLDDQAGCDRPCANARDRRLLELLMQIKKEGRVPEQLLGLPAI